MTAREKIEKLTHAWYGFDLFAGAIGLLMGGIGVFSLVWAALSTASSLAITYVIGRKLVNKSSLTRSAMIVVAFLGSVLGVFGLVKTGMDFFDDWSLGLVWRGVLIGGAVSMYARSLRVLLDKSVKAYFA